MNNKYQLIYEKIAPCSDNLLIESKKMMDETEEDIFDVVNAIQDGEFSTVKEAISNRIVPIDSLDQDGCTFLHWAAINNRIKIANFLIDNGLIVTGGGGILNESPFQWAIRKKFYRMVELLFEKGCCDLNHRSVQGSDALHLACKLGDINAVFLLLSWGADPDTIDNTGDTPILWLLKNRFGNTTFEIIKLLIKFGANPTFANEVDGNTALHVLANITPINYSIAFVLYHASCPYGVESMENKKSLTPYALSVVNENRVFARFLYDALLFHFMPYWSPAFLVIILIFLFAFLIDYFGVIYAIIYWFIIYALSFWMLGQWKIASHRGRIYVGLFIGFYLISITEFEVFIAPYISPYSRLLVWSLFICLGYFAYKLHIKKPVYSKLENKKEIINKIVSSSPAEGPENDSDDEFSHLDSSSHSRFLGPKICGVCLSDKRSIFYPPEACKSCKKENYGSNSELDIEIGKRRRFSSEGSTSSFIGGKSKGMISLATHCETCDACVVDVDMHASYFGNCIGRGNRRLFFGILLLQFLVFSVFFYLSKWAHYNIFCTQASKNPISWLFAIEYCGWSKFHSLYLVTWASFFVSMASIFLAQAEISLVAQESTITILSLRRTNIMRPPKKKLVRNILNFVFNGTYNVVYSKQNRASIKKHETQVTMKNTLANQNPQIDSAVSLFQRIDKKLGEKQDSNESSFQNSPLSVKFNLSTNPSESMNRTLDPEHSRCRQPEKEQNERIKDLLTNPNLTDMRSKIATPQSSLKTIQEDQEVDDLNDEFDDEFVESEYNTYQDQFLAEDSDYDSDESDSNPQYAYVNPKGDSEALLQTDQKGNSISNRF